MDHQEQVEEALSGPDVKRPAAELNTIETTETLFKQRFPLSLQLETDSIIDKVVDNNVNSVVVIIIKISHQHHQTRYQYHHHHHHHHHNHFRHRILLY